MLTRWSQPTIISINSFSTYISLYLLSSVSHTASVFYKLSYSVAVTGVVPKKCSQAGSSAFQCALNKGAQYADLQVEHPVCTSTDPFPLRSLLPHMNTLLNVMKPCG